MAARIPGAPGYSAKAARRRRARDAFCVRTICVPLGCNCACTRRFRSRARFTAPVRTTRSTSPSSSLPIRSDERTRGMSLEEKRALGHEPHGSARRERNALHLREAPEQASPAPFDTVAVPDVSEKPDWSWNWPSSSDAAHGACPRAAALDYVAGYTIANDITLREKVFRRKTDSPELGMDFVISKGAPGFLPLGRSIWCRRRSCPTRRSCVSP